MEKITKREMYEAIIEAMKTGEVKYAPDVVIEFCEKEIASLDRKAAKAKETAAKKRAEGDALTDMVRNALTEEFRTIADITATVAVEDPEVTVSKVTYRLTQLAKNGEAEKQEVSVPGGEGQKARKVMAYRIACEPVD